jgi:hypothetical protein
MGSEVKKYPIHSTVSLINKMMSMLALNQLLIGEYFVSTDLLLPYSLLLIILY